jgi:hypothetical protein
VNGGGEKRLGNGKRQHIVAAGPLKMSAVIKLAIATLAAPTFLLACAGAAPSAPAPAAAPSPSLAPQPPEPKLEDRAWGVLRSKAHGLKLALPEARSWLEPRRGAPGASWELLHEPTGSTLTIKRWRASRLPRVDACRAELAEAVPDLASVDETTLVSSHEVRVPEGFVTRITLLALPGSKSRLGGQAQGVSAGVGECIAMIARTECASEAELAERLRLFDVALAHVRLIQVDDRVPERAPLSH